MKTVIYSTPNCPYCKSAKTLAESKGHEVEYIDITTVGIDKVKLSEIVGQPVTTVPQILVDGQYIGGFEDFQKFVNAPEKEDPNMNYFTREIGESNWELVDFQHYMLAQNCAITDFKKEPK